jgi:hypothetical protein
VIAIANSVRGNSTTTEDSAPGGIRGAVTYCFGGTVAMKCRHIIDVSWDVTDEDRHIISLPILEVLNTPSTDGGEGWRRRQLPLCNHEGIKQQHQHQQIRIH